MKTLDKKLKMWRKIWNRFVCDYLDEADINIVDQLGNFQTFFYDNKFISHEKYVEFSQGIFSTIPPPYSNNCCTDGNDVVNLDINSIKYINDEFTIDINIVSMSYSQRKFSISFGINSLNKDSKSRHLYPNVYIVGSNHRDSNFRKDLLLSLPFRFLRSNDGRPICFGQFNLF